ncbi:Short C-terminal domain-containing protein [Parapedobacter composti]|uniref:Short C-terminal domain-containing protein n=1 Tax=Parapedobacter composti TaxID=623281 RepID=A0A1I1JLR0_9SPHI|nr:PH domain-containing protein [Parapedobacter composti]SFC49091.1 Short C-terminal domain-containing protein [Parapedobacter composti]
MKIDQYISDGQDPKIAEKLLLKLQDMLTSGEAVTYIAVQKKPAVTLLPDSIALTNKRVFICEFTKLGLATDFKILIWEAVKAVTFKEEIFGAKVTVVPEEGENLSVDYIPKTQARRVFQFANEALEKRKTTIVEKPEEEEELPMQPEEEPVLIQREAIGEHGDPEDELTLKLRKLKSLFERQLITQAEYESKKNELLSQL